MSLYGRRRQGIFYVTDILCNSRYELAQKPCPNSAGFSLGLRTMTSPDHSLTTLITGWLYYPLTKCQFYGDHTVKT